MARNSILKKTTSKPLIGITEAARRTGLSKFFIKQACIDKELEAFFIRGTWRIPEDELEKFMLRALNVAR